MTDAAINPTGSRPPSKIWRVFDVALLVFIVFDFLFAIPASFFATYRVGEQPLRFEVYMMLLFAVTLWLLAIDLICLLVRAFRKRVTAFSVIVFICLGAHIFLVGVFCHAGEAYGLHLLAKNGVNQRVAQECLLITQSDVCGTGVPVETYFGMLDLDRGTNKLAQMVQAR